MPSQFEIIGNTARIHPEIQHPIEQFPEADLWAEAMRSGELIYDESNILFTVVPWWDVRIVDPDEWSDEEPTQEIQEEYGRSLRVMRAAGEAALNGASNSKEIRELRNEYDTAFGEMLKTADGIGEFVRIERRGMYKIENNMVVTDSSYVLEYLIDRGVERSREIAQTSDPRFILQAERDEADLTLFTEFVQPMANQEISNVNTVLAVSAYPEDMEAVAGEQFCKELGYNTKFKCAMLQLYHRAPNGRLLTRVISIDASNVADLAEQLRGLGVNIPADVTSSQLITHPLLANMSYKDASKLMDKFADEYEAKHTLPKKLATTDEVLHKHAKFREQMFQDFYLHIATSLVRTALSPNLHEMLQLVINAGRQLNTQTLERLKKIRETTFDDDAARFLHGVILYMSAETVRDAIEPKKLRPVTGKPKRLSQHNFQTATVSFTPDIQDFATLISWNFVQGVRAGREYGGCGALFAFGRANPQHEFGGKYGEDNSWNAYEDDAGDGKGPLYFKCTNNHWCKRPFNGTLDECGKCKDGGVSVGCGKMVAKKR